LLCVQLRHFEMFELGVSNIPLGYKMSLFYLQYSDDQANSYHNLTFTLYAVTCFIRVFRQQPAAFSG